MPLVVRILVVKQWIIYYFILPIQRKLWTPGMQHFYSIRSIYGRKLGIRARIHTLTNRNWLTTLFFWYLLSRFTYSVDSLSRIFFNTNILFYHQFFIPFHSTALELDFPRDPAHPTIYDDTWTHFCTCPFFVSGMKLHKFDTTDTLHTWTIRHIPKTPRTGLGYFCLEYQYWFSFLASSFCCRAVFLGGKSHFRLCLHLARLGSAAGKHLNITFLLK